MNPVVTPLHVPTTRQGLCDAPGLALVPVQSRCELAVMSQYMLGPQDLSRCHDLFRASIPREQCALSLMSPRAALPSLSQLACVLDKHHVSQQILRTHTAWWAFEPLCLASGCFLYLRHFPVPGTMGKGGQCQAAKERAGRGVGAAVECSCPTVSSFCSCTEILAILLARFLPEGFWRCLQLGITKPSCL